MSDGGDNMETNHDRAYLDSVSSFVEAYASDDDEGMSRLFPLICDNPGFDAALAHATARIDTDELDTVAFRHGLMSMSSITCAPYESSRGRALALIQIMFIPLSGILAEMEHVVSSTETLTAIAKSLIETDMVTKDSSVMAMGNLVDPSAAAAITPGKVRLALRMISPVLTGKIDGENLGDALATVFDISPGAGFAHDRIYAHRLLPIARIVTPADGIQQEDPLSSYRIDSVGEASFMLKRWHNRMRDITKGKVTVGDPCSITRGCAVMAINTMEHAFLSRASRLGRTSIPDFEEVSLAEQDDVVNVTARHGRDIYGPVRIPSALFSADLPAITEYVDTLSMNVGWHDRDTTVAAGPKPN